MNAKFLVIGAAALGLMAMTSTGRALPVASLGTIVTDSSNVTQAHFSKSRHTHRGGQIVWSYERTGEKMTTGRSVAKKKKHMKKMETPSSERSTY